MAKPRVEKTPIEGLYVLTPVLFEDERGYFAEVYNERELAAVGIEETFVQDNQSGSVRGTLRGLHFQKRKPQAKLVRVIYGRVFDVAVDLREGSSTKGRWFGLELTEKNKKQLYIPKGFAHGFLTLSSHAEFCYKTSDYYDPLDEEGISWNDSTIGVQWQDVVGACEGNGARLADGSPLILSEKDKAWRSFLEWEKS